MIATLSDFNTYVIDITAMPNELKQFIMKELDIDSDMTSIVLSETDIDKYNIPDNCIYENSYEFDEEDFLSVMKDCVGKHHYYLLYGEHMRWNGVSGYKIIDNLLDIVKRSYDFNLNILEKVGKDTVLCIESSHDVPTGTTLYIIGLNNKDAKYLEDCDFNDIETYVKNRIS